MSVLTSPLEFQVLQHLIASLMAINGQAFTDYRGRAARYYFAFKASSVSGEPQEVWLVPPTEHPFALVVMPDVSSSRAWAEKPDGLRDDLVASIVAITHVPNAVVPLAKQEAGQQLAADIEVALAQDQSRGGLVMETLVQRPRLLYGFGNDGTVLLQTEVRMPLYREHGRPTNWS